MSLVLRHRPEVIGLRLEGGGWARIDELVRKGRESADAPLTRKRLRLLVAEQDKPRFSLDESGERIRANYGHSIDVDLDLELASPPDVLYHGTSDRNLETILREGLDPRSRRYVHLSVDPETAREVGRRHGTPRILRVRAAEMAGEGHPFHRPAPGFWLTPRVPPRFLDPWRP